MKRVYIFILLIFGINLISFCQTNLINGARILLIKYSESKQCKDVDNLKDDAEFVKWEDFCDDFIGIIDDFSEFFYNTKIFFAQTNLTGNENSKLIFWDYDYIKEIDSLPFIYSKIKINSLVNDSIVKIEYDNKKQILNSKMSISDSIIEVKHHDNKTTYTKTKFYIENIGLLEKESIIDLNKVEFKNTGELLRNLASNEIISRYEGGIDSLSTFLSRNIINSEKARGLIVIRMNIDFLGKIKEIEIIRGINKKFDDELIRVMKTTKWLPSKYEKDLLFDLPFKFEK
jgi:hypothetical protein